MKNKLVISPSVLSLDYSHMKEQMEQINESKAEWLHFDVMDGHFVPNLTFGPDLLKGIKQMTDCLLDVHLMVSDPMHFAPVFIEAGAGMVTFHTEAFDNDCAKIKECLDLIHSKGVMAGIVVKPKTEIEQFESILDAVDMVLVMSVEPGFGGQSFMADQLDKIAWLHENREKKGLSYRIEIDGGINTETAKQAKEAGCDTLVAGSYVFEGNIVEKVDSLL